MTSCARVIVPVYASSVNVPLVSFFLLDALQYKSLNIKSYKLHVIDGFWSSSHFVIRILHMYIIHAHITKNIFILGTLNWV